jgi:hypothetical protein
VDFRSENQPRAVNSMDGPFGQQPLRENLDFLVLIRLLDAAFPCSGGSPTLRLMFQLRSCCSSKCSGETFAVAKSVLM